MSASSYHLQLREYYICTIQTKSLYEMREQGILSNQQIRILEQQVVAKEEELDSLKDAYRTKLKKADAWEKVRLYIHVLSYLVLCLLY